MDDTLDDISSLMFPALSQHRVHSNGQPNSQNTQDVSPGQQRSNDEDRQYLPLVSPAIAANRRVWYGRQDVEGGLVGSTNTPLRSDRPFFFFFSYSLFPRSLTRAAKETSASETPGPGEGPRSSPCPDRMGVGSAMATLVTAT